MANSLLPECASDAVRTGPRFYFVGQLVRPRNDSLTNQLRPADGVLRRPLGIGLLPGRPRAVSRCWRQRGLHLGPSMRTSSAPRTLSASLRRAPFNRPFRELSAGEYNAPICAELTSCLGRVTGQRCCRSNSVSPVAPPASSRRRGGALRDLSAPARGTVGRHSSRRTGCAQDRHGRGW